MKKFLIALTFLLAITFRPSISFAALSSTAEPYGGSTEQSSASSNSESAQSHSDGAYIKTEHATKETWLWLWGIATVEFVVFSIMAYKMRQNDDDITGFIMLMCLIGAVIVGIMQAVVYEEGGVFFLLAGSAFVGVIVGAIYSNTKDDRVSP